MSGNTHLPYSSWEVWQLEEALDQRGISSSGSREHKIKRLQTSDHLLCMYRPLPPPNIQLSAVPMSRFYIASFLLLDVIIFLVQHWVWQNLPLLIVEMWFRTTDNTRSEDAMFYWFLNSRHIIYDCLSYIHILAAVTWNIYTVFSRRQEGATWAEVVCPDPKSCVSFSLALAKQCLSFFTNFHTVGAAYRLTRHTHSWLYDLPTIIPSRQHGLVRFGQGQPPPSGEQLYAPGSPCCPTQSTHRHTATTGDTALLEGPPLYSAAPQVDGIPTPRQSLHVLSGEGLKHYQVTSSHVYVQYWKTLVFIRKHSPRDLPAEVCNTKSEDLARQVTLWQDQLAFAHGDGWTESLPTAGLDLNLALPDLESKRLYYNEALFNLRIIVEKYSALFPVIQRLGNEYSRVFKRHERVKGQLLIYDQSAIKFMERVLVLTSGPDGSTPCALTPGDRRNLEALVARFTDDEHASRMAKRWKNRVEQADALKAEAENRQSQAGRDKNEALARLDDVQAEKETVLRDTARACTTFLATLQSLLHSDQRTRRDLQQQPDDPNEFITYAQRELVRVAPLIVKQREVGEDAAVRCQSLQQELDTARSQLSRSEQDRIAEHTSLAEQISEFKHHLGMVFLQRGKLWSVARIRDEGLEPESEEIALWQDPMRPNVVVVRDLSATGGGPRTPLEFKFGTVVGAVEPTKRLYPELETLMWGWRRGYKVGVVMEGQSGSGKTHTMFGAGDSIFDFVTQAVFAQRDALRGQGRVGTVHYGAVEIYQDKVFNLDDPAKAGPQPMKKDEKSWDWALQSSTSLEVADLHKFMRQACQRRHQNKTQKNAQSSRSHMVVKLTLVVPEAADKRSSFDFLLVDLAGSEHQDKLTTGSLDQSELHVLKQEGLAIAQSRFNFKNYLRTRLTSSERGTDPLTKIARRNLDDDARLMLVACLRPKQVDLSASKAVLQEMKDYVDVRQPGEAQQDVGKRQQKSS